MNSHSNSAVLDQLFEPVSQCVTPEVARRIAALRASPDIQRRLVEFAEKSSEGTLSAEERTDYAAWVRTINFLSVLQAKTRKIVALSNSP